MSWRGKRQTGGISTGAQQLHHFGDDKSKFGKKQRQKEKEGYISIG